MNTNSIKIVAAGAALTAAVVGCRHIRPDWSVVGKDYEEPEIEVSEQTTLPPDAGYPTTNKTATGEIAAAKDDADPRMEITPEMLSGWWKRFDDPILNSLMANAVSNNYTFLMAQQRLEQSRWAYIGSAAAFMPSFALDGSATRAESHRNNTRSQMTSGVRHYETDTFQGGFDATWEIDVFGGRSRANEAAESRMQSAACSLRDALVSLTAEIGRQYINLRTTQQRIGVARTNLVLQSETYDILKSRLDSGIGDELAVNQARYNLEQTRAVIPAQLAQQEVLENALAILVGAMPGELHEILGTLPSRDWLIAPQKLGSIPLDTMRARPDVKAVERELAAQVASVGVAESLLLPKFYLNGSLGLESVKMQKFLQPGSLYATIGPSFSWPIFQGGNIIANIRQEEAKMNEACLKYGFAIQKAFEETRNAYSSYTQQYHRFESLKSAVKAAKDAENIAQDLYKNGLADFNNVLDAQRSLLTLEEELTISQGQITVNLIALYKALGGGYSF